jgi:hypothetical protein
VTCQSKKSDQIDQTCRGFLVFGFVELGGLSGEGRDVKEGIRASKVKGGFPTKYCNPCETARIIRL